MQSNTMTNLTIREATTADLPALMALSRTTFMEAFASQNKTENMSAYMEEAFNENQLMNELLDNASVFYLVFIGKDLVGYAKLRTSKQQAALQSYRSVEIQRIYVLKELKGKKIGKLLMQTCLDTAGKRGYEVVWLGVWEHNPSAITFYQRWGFEQFSSYIFHFGDENQTDHLMRKFLVKSGEVTSG